jgi:hypothetical protein
MTAVRGLAGLLLVLAVTGCTVARPQSTRRSEASISRARQCVACMRR